LLDFHRYKPTLNPIALGEFSGSGIGVTAKWVNELDQVKALADRSVGLYQAFYAGHFTPGILRRGRSYNSGRRGRNNESRQDWQDFSGFCELG
jgi:hypothetical protein